MKKSEQIELLQEENLFLKSQVKYAECKYESDTATNLDWTEFYAEIDDDNEDEDDDEISPEVQRLAADVLSKLTDPANDNLIPDEDVPSIRIQISDNDTIISIEDDSIKSVLSAIDSLRSK